MLSFPLRRSTNNRTFILHSQDILSLDDLAENGWQLYDLILLPDAQPRKAHRVARRLLETHTPAFSTPPSSSSTTSSRPPLSRAPSSSPADRANQLKATVALLIGLHALAISNSSDSACLEDLLQSLVGIFIKGIVRSPKVARDQRLPNELVERMTGDELYEQDHPWCLWQLASYLVNEKEKKRPSLADSELDVQSTRTLINLLYLKALLVSASDTQALADTRSSFLFSEVVRLGCSIDITGASPTLPSSSTSQESHLSTLVWKSRKRLELFGHVDVALSGLPNGGKEFDRWGGGAQEKTRLAEEAQRQRDLKRGTGRRSPKDGRPQRLSAQSGEEEVDCCGSEQGGQLLAPPIRLKGKKVRHHRAGSYDFRGTLGLTAKPRDSGVILRLAEEERQKQLPESTTAVQEQLDYFQYPPSLMAGRRNISQTSLPSLDRRQSTHLLRTPPTSPISLHHNLEVQYSQSLGSPLKAMIPRPLPMLVDTQALFSISHADDFHPEEGLGEGDHRLSWMQVIRAQALIYSFRLKPLNDFRRRKSTSPFDALFGTSASSAVASETATPDPSSAEFSSSQPSPSPSLSTSFSSQSSFSSPLQSPIPIPLQVPAIGFTPSSHHPSMGVNSIGRGGKTLRSFTPYSSRLDGKLRREL